ncbi:Helix-turn-helix domain-containing protein [Mycolicibacterium rutilum]|uniref:Helix-turn-helix domain-containing protein n=1 Tax=Mycolicibacterium rutilum TaxID=370526 RepID=A0A1H6IJ58_MYCRU|nr:helix-turn-helix domain-containing protein [Mycolicibacterium rutilum]SEH48623.1 Helix-turn-helix domain-containing protein [Mycolicibacterium rutilum]
MRVEFGGRPAAPLRPFVTGYTGFDLWGFEPGVHVGTPAHTLTAVMTFGEPLEIEVPTEMNGPSGSYPSMASGLMTRAISIRHGGRQRGIKLSLTPLGARVVYGVPAGALVDTVVPLPDVLGNLWPELETRIGEATTWPRRFEILDDVLARAVAGTVRTRTRALDVRPEVAETWNRLVAAHGQARVSDLANELGWSRRHLSARFREEFGLTPKTLARILRFEHAVRLVSAGGTPAWAELSTAAGYADQAHLVRDWRSFTGRTPTSWFTGDVLVDGRSHG